MCGKEGKNISVSFEDKVSLSDSFETRREFYEKNPKTLIAVKLITIISPFIGLFLVGLLGVVAGLLLGVMAYFLSPKAIKKVIEIRQG